MEFLFEPIEQIKLVRSKELYDAICVKHNDKLCAEVVIDGICVNSNNSRIN